MNSEIERLNRVRIEVRDVDFDKKVKVTTFYSKTKPNLDLILTEINKTLRIKKTKRGGKNE